MREMRKSTPKDRHSPDGMNVATCRAAVDTETGEVGKWDDSPAAPDKVRIAPGKVQGHYYV